MHVSYSTIRNAVVQIFLFTYCAFKFAKQIAAEETRELPGERNKATNNARCTQARKATHGLDRRHRDVDRTLRGRVSQNDRGQG